MLIIDRIDQICERFETKLGLYFAAILFGLLLMGAASIYVTPALKTINHGDKYQQLSVSPFDFSIRNSMQYRILTPLIAYVLFLRGKLYILVPNIIAVLFLASIYLYFRKNDFSQSESLGVAALIAFSTPIVFLLHFQGYVDITSYLLLFLCIVFIQKPFIWPLLFSLAILNHESSFFCAPWIFLLANKELKLRKAFYSVSLILIALIPTILFRYYLSLKVNVSLSHSYYLNINNILRVIKGSSQGLSWGIFESFKLFWFIPIIAMFNLLKKKQYQQSFLLLVIIFCAFGQLFFAMDTTRLCGIAFPAVLLGAYEMKKVLGKDIYAIRLWQLILLNFFVPVYYIGGSYGGNPHVIPFFSLPLSLILKFVFGVDAWQLWWT